MQIVMCRQLSPRAYNDRLPLSEALRARIRVFLGQGPRVTDSSLAKRPQSAVAALRRTVVRVVTVFWPAAPQCANGEGGGRPGFPQMLLHAARPGLQLSTRALADPSNNGRPRGRLAIAGWCYGASPLHSSTGVSFDAKGAVG